MMLVLLVEDNASEEMLAMLAIRKADVSADVVVARDGQEALDYLFGGGEHADRPTSRLPTVALLDLNLPKIGGLDVLRRIRADERTRRLPVVVLTTSKEDEDLARAGRGDGVGVDAGVGAGEEHGNGLLPVLEFFEQLALPGINVALKFGNAFNNL